MAHGKPLIQYTIDCARELFEDKDIIVSTDSQQIKDTVEQLGLYVPFLRPEEISTDTASSRQVILHTLDFCKRINNDYPEKVILLQPTSPLRKKVHLIESLKLFSKNIDMVVSVNENYNYSENNMFYEDSSGFLKKYNEREINIKYEKLWSFNGAIYIINTISILKTKILDFKKIKKYKMCKKTSLDIDDLNDWNQFINYNEFLK